MIPSGFSWSPEGFVLWGYYIMTLWFFKNKKQPQMRLFLMVKHYFWFDLAVLREAINIRLISSARAIISSKSYSIIWVLFNNVSQYILFSFLSSLLIFIWKSRKRSVKKRRVKREENKKKSHTFVRLFFMAEKRRLELLRRFPDLRP